MHPTPSKDEAGTIDRFRILFERAPICVHEIDTSGRLTSMNRAGLALVGLESEEHIRGLAYLDFVDAAQRDRVSKLLDAALRGQASEFEFRVTGPEGPRTFTSCFIPCPGPDGRIERLIGVTADVTERERTANELHRLNRVHAVLARCNNSLARAIDEQDLLEAFCTNLAEVGGYGYVWIGYAQRHPRLAVCRMAEAGGSDRDLAAAVNAWARAEGSTAACREAVRRGRPIVLRDIGERSRYAPWCEVALRRGYRSMIALPLKRREIVFGNVDIFAEECDAFDKAEVSLLEDLVQDLSFGIQTARTRAGRAQRMRHLRDGIERNERRRLAAILHDGVGQSAQAVNLGLKSLRAGRDMDEAQRAGLLDQLIAETSDVIAELRELSHELRPLFFEHTGLEEAIRCHCRELAARAGLDIRVSGDLSRVSLDEHAKEQCFLGVREALGNALRHAKASRIEIRFATSETGQLTIDILDDGVGFDPQGSPMPPAGNGLAMIDERARSLGGQAQVQSTPGKGTRVHIGVPVAAASGPCP